MSAQNFGRKQVYVPPEGAIRKSQVVSTFGPGAMVDLVEQAVLIGGLDFWNFSKEHGRRTLEEPRLRDALAETLRKSGRGELAVENAFIEPPECDDRGPTKAAGVQALEFPQWFVCQQPACRALVRARDGLERKGGRYVHQCTNGKRGDCVPVRFVGACKRGHLEDWPWVRFAHRQHQGQPCHAPDLRLDEGATGDFSEIQIRCRTCNDFAHLASALADAAKPPCSGLRPWLGNEGMQECSERLRLLVRTASNSYFSQVVSALSLPSDPRQALADAVASVWKTVEVVASNPALLAPFRNIPDVQKALAAWPDAQVIAAIQARASGVPVPRDPLRSAEFRQLRDAPEATPGDRPQRGDNFFVRRLAPDAKTPLPHGITRVVLAHKLREIRAQLGFTRIEALTPDLQGEYDLGVTSASLGLTTNWLPATEVLGEGVFIELDEKAVHDWERLEPVKERAAQLAAGFEAWALRFEPEHRPHFPGIRFYLLHSLSHLLITAISFECGYAASAIRERIYCAPHEDRLTAMAAILLSTGTPGTEGTLGGLVEQGRYLRQHLRRAFDEGVLCSNDPVCASHSPAADHAERYLEGAACHGCLFIAEPSCERFNQYLDRALVVPTIGHPSELAFFRVRP